MDNQTNTNNSTTLEAAVRQKSTRLIQARFLEDTGRFDDAIVVYRQVAQEEEWISQEIINVGQGPGQAAVNLLSSASCWKKIGAHERAIKLLEEVLKIQEASAPLKREVDSLLREWRSHRDAQAQSLPSGEKEAFDRLLLWLDPNRDQAGQKYEDIRRRLIKFFGLRGSAAAEDLTDETFYRVMKKIGDISDTYVGDPTPYFYGVAKYVYTDYERREASRIVPPPSKLPFEIEQEYECLERCMETLTPNNRELLLQYYGLEGQAKTYARKQLAQRSKLSLNSLRIRVLRLRASLRRCIESCRQEVPA